METNQQIEQLIGDAFDNLHGNSNLIALEPLWLAIKVSLDKHVSRQMLLEVVENCRGFEFVSIEMPLTGECGSFIQDNRNLDAAPESSRTIC